MTQVSREDIIKEAPDFVQIASKHMQDAYVEYERIRIKLDECPDRFVTYEGHNGVLHSIDLKYVNLKGVMKNRGAEEDIKDALEIRAKVIVPLLAQYNRARSKYMHTFDLYNDRSKALAKLTPMLLDLFGSMYSIKDVKKTIKKREGYDLEDGELTKFYNENKLIIENRQNKYVVKSDKYRVATEAGRLEILNDILTDLQLKYRQRSRDESIDYITRNKSNPGTSKKRSKRE